MLLLLPSLQSFLLLFLVCFVVVLVDITCTLATTGIADTNIFSFIQVSGLLFFNRKALYNPKIHAIMGFLYARFQKGSEFWEMHEVVRKCALMGLVSFFN